jgi:fibronectin type 3 domain-containing protein
MKYVFAILLALFSKTLSSQSLPQSTTHYVNLKWDAGTDNGDPEVGFFIYRSASGNNSFTKVESTPTVPTTFNDSTMEYGSSYNYYVTSVDANGNESGPSNTTTVFVPNVPYTPILEPITTGP